MNLTRRRLLVSAGALGATGLLTACSGATSAPTVAPAAPAPTAAATAAPPVIATVAAAPTPPPTAPPAPAATVLPAAAAAPTAAAAATRTPAPAVAGKQMYQQDAQHTGRSQYAGPRQGRVLRRFDMSTPDNLPPDVAIPRADVQSSSAIGPDGTIYIADFAGILFALKDNPSASDQVDVVWRFHQPLASSFHATPALSSDGKTLYLGFASGGANAPTQATFYAVDAATGQQQWSADLGATRVMASPTVGPDGTIYVGTADGKLFAVGADGKVRWTAQTGPSVKTAPALATDGTVYHPTSDGKMYAVSPQGQVKWSFDFGQHLGPTPLMTSDAPGPGGGGGANGVGTGASATIGADGTIYVGANNSNMYAVTPDGNLKWLFEAERELAGIWTTPTLSADNMTISFGANKGGVYGLNTANGSKRWQFPIYGSIYASSTLDSKGTLFTGTTIEHLYAMDNSTGEPIWDLDIHNPIWSAPSIRPDGTLVIADRSGLVQVIG